MKTDPDPHKSAADPQHCVRLSLGNAVLILNTFFTAPVVPVGTCLYIFYRKHLLDLYSRARSLGRLTELPIFGRLYWKEVCIRIRIISLARFRIRNLFLSFTNKMKFLN